MGKTIGAGDAEDLGSSPSECQIFSFVQLRPFLCAALAKRWKVQFRKGLHKFNNVGSNTTYFSEKSRIM